MAAALDMSLGKFFDFVVGILARGDGGFPVVFQCIKGSFQRLELVLCAGRVLVFAFLDLDCGIEFIDFLVSCFLRREGYVSLNLAIGEKFFAVCEADKNVIGKLGVDDELVDGFAFFLHQRHFRDQFLAVGRAAVADPCFVEFMQLAGIEEIEQAFGIESVLAAKDSAIDQVEADTSPF